MAQPHDSDLDAVVQSIEDKLQLLEGERDQLLHDIEVQRTLIRDITRTIAMVRGIDERLAE